MSEAPTPNQKSADVVGVLRSTDLTQVFEAARPLTASIAEGGELMQHPLEDGSVIVDHLVQKPTEITLPMMITGDFKPVLDEMRQLYKAGTILVVQTRSGSYASMVIYDMPHEETAEAFDAITVTLKLREAKFVKPKQGGPVPRAKKHATATKRGQVQAKPPAPAPRGSFLFRHIPVP